jgi:multicomponent Na+:H+ antiporter subunit C
MLALGQYNYWVVILLMMSGFYIVLERGNLIKQVVGLNMFQTSVFILYISLANVAGGTAPIIHAVEGETYSNPLPHVLILTAIVVNVSTTAVALALVVRIKETYGSIEQDDIDHMNDDVIDGGAGEVDGNQTSSSSLRRRSGDTPA